MPEPAITLADLDDWIEEYKARDRELRATIERAQREQRSLRDELYVMVEMKKRHLRKVDRNDG